MDAPPPRPNHPLRMGGASRDSKPGHPLRMMGVDDAFVQRIQESHERSQRGPNERPRFHHNEHHQRGKGKAGRHHHMNREQSVRVEDYFCKDMLTDPWIDLYSSLSVEARDRETRHLSDAEKEIVERNVLYTHSAKRPNIA